MDKYKCVRIINKKNSFPPVTLMANAVQEKLQDFYQVVKRTVGVAPSSSMMDQEFQQQQHTSAITCDDCSRIFSVSSDFKQTEKKKRCDRYLQNYCS